MAIISYALKPNGYLVLGESESVGKFTSSFEPITKRGVVFKKKFGQPKVELPVQTPNPFSKEIAAMRLPKKIDTQNLLNEEIDQLLLAQFTPPSLLVNNNSDIIVVRGQVNPYVSIESGTPSFSITKLLRKEIRPTVQTTLYRAKNLRKMLRK